MRTLFATSSHALTAVFDGQQALDELSKSDFKGYDLVLLDLEMPLKNGLDTVKEIRKRTNILPVIMVTSINDSREIAKLLDAGANEYVMKPFTKDILFEKISQVIGQEVI
jgi:two-component system chemotaxis response regulator CheY